MANEANNKGVIGKYYKEMFPYHNQKTKANIEALEMNDPLFRNSNTQDIYNSPSNILKNYDKLENSLNIELDSKENRYKVSESWPRLRRRSRQDRKQSKPK